MPPSEVHKLLQQFLLRIYELEERVDQLEQQLARQGIESMSASQPSQAKLNDDMYNAALQIVIEEKQVSTKLLQTKLEIGYTRAVILLDMLEQEGIIGPPNGDEPRNLRI